MNTLRKDEATSGLEEFYSDNPLLAEKYRPVIDDMKRGTVVEKLLHAGLVDAAHSQALPTLPTQLFPAKVHTAFLRLDYCFHSASLRSHALPLSIMRLRSEALIIFLLSARLRRREGKNARHRGHDGASRGRRCPAGTPNYDACNRDCCGVS